MESLNVPVGGGLVRAGADLVHPETVAKLAEQLALEVGTLICQYLYRESMYTKKPCLPGSARRLRLPDFVEGTTPPTL